MTRNMSIFHVYRGIYHYKSKQMIRNMSVFHFYMGVYPHKSGKYSYFWSFLDFGEENKKFLKLNSTGPLIFSLRQEE